MDKLIHITSIRKDGNKTFVTFRKKVQVGDHFVFQRMPEIELSGNFSKEEAAIELYQQNKIA